MNSGMIGLIILVSILAGILVLILMKGMFEEKKLNKLIGQDLTSYSKDELLKLKDKYQTYCQYQPHIKEFWEETDRIMNEIFMREIKIEKQAEEYFCEHCENSFEHDNGHCSNCSKWDCFNAGAKWGMETICKKILEEVEKDGFVYFGTPTVTKLKEIIKGLGVNL